MTFHFSKLVDADALSAHIKSGTIDVFHNVDLDLTMYKVKSDRVSPNVTTPLIRRVNGLVLQSSNGMIRSWPVPMAVPLTSHAVNNWIHASDSYRLISDPCGIPLVSYVDETGMLRLVSIDEGWDSNTTFYANSLLDRDYSDWLADAKPESFTYHFQLVGDYNPIWSMPTESDKTDLVLVAFVGNNVGTEYSLKDCNWPGEIATRTAELDIDHTKVGYVHSSSNKLVEGFGWPSSGKWIISFSCKDGTSLDNNDFDLRPRAFVMSPLRTALSTLQSTLTAHNIWTCLKAQASVDDILGVIDFEYHVWALDIMHDIISTHAEMRSRAYQDLSDGLQHCSERGIGYTYDRENHKYIFPSEADRSVFAAYVKANAEKVWLVFSLANGNNTAYSLWDQVRPTQRITPVKNSEKLNATVG